MPSHRSPTRTSKSSSKSRKSPDRERSKKHKHHRNHDEYEEHHHHHSRESHRHHESSSREKLSTSGSSSNRKTESFTPSSSSSRKRQYYSSGEESPERRDDSKRSKGRIKEEKDDGREGSSRKGDSHRDSPKVSLSKEEASTSAKSDSKNLADLIPDEDAADWVMKSRKIEEERRKIEKLKAERKARMLDEMDDEIVNQVAGRRSKNINELYTEKDLKGLQVAHSEKYLKEGHQFIMTLKDKDVLDENDDVLENVNLVDIEKAEKNMDNKLKKDEYRPYDEPEFDEFGILKKKNILAKYDEELEGAQRKTFQIGSSSIDREAEAELIRERLRQQAGVISLETPSFKVASEYYTEEEMVKFKKPKKISQKVRTKGKRSKISESIISHDSSADHGSRKNRTATTDPAVDADEMSPSTSAKLPTIDSSSIIKMETPDEDDDSESESDFPDVDLSGIILEEQEAEEEFRRSLERTKRLKQKENERKDEEERIAKLIAEREACIKKEKEDDPLDLPSNSQGNRSTIVLNATAEFCRNLGDISTIKEEDEDDDELMDFEKDLVDDRKHQPDSIQEKIMEEPTRGTWNEVDMEASAASFDSNDAADPMQPILEEEPDVSLGVAAALKVAMKKGYLDKEPRKPTPGSRHSSLQAQNYTIEEKFYDEERMGRRDRYNGPLSDFKEKDSYKPDIKLDYVDEKGRLLNQKEAFRVLSHKFHGKGPGKNKIDKRMKKLDQGEKLRQMHSTDTPLGTLKLLQDKQKELNTPYVVLSGTASSTSSSLTKK